MLIRCPMQRSFLRDNGFSSRSSTEEKPLSIKRAKSLILSGLYVRGTILPAVTSRDFT
jgi:hypothetical protein